VIIVLVITVEYSIDKYCRKETSLNNISLFEFFRVIYKSVLQLVLFHGIIWWMQAVQAC